MLPIKYLFNFDCLDSSSRFLKHFARECNTPSLCVVREQTSGYGQQAKVWSSQRSDITFSMSANIDGPIHDFPGLSQRISHIIAKALIENTRMPIKLKWPNDLFYDGSKVGGVLIEVVRTLTGQSTLVIGIGINLQQPIGIPADYKLGCLIINGSRLSFITELAKLINSNLSSIRQGTSVIKPSIWASVDLFNLGEVLNYIDSDGEQHQVIYHGINEFGEAIISFCINPKKYKFLHSGRDHLRRL